MIRTPMANQRQVRLLGIGLAIASIGVAACVPASNETQGQRSFESKAPTASTGPSAANAPSATSAITLGGSLRLGLDWGRAPAVERPDEAFDFGAAGTMAPAIDPNTAGHPGHFPGQAIMSDVVVSASTLVAVGYVYPGWRPIAWTSPDGISWSLHQLPGDDYTFAVSVAAGPHGSLVAVGRTGTSPAAWTSMDGLNWESRTVPILGSGQTAERMTTVLATSRGYVAGGSVGPELFERHARFWLSPDGSRWQPVPDDATTFADAEVRSIVPFDTGYVAIGSLGTGERVTGSLVWTSIDGKRWVRHDDPALATGKAVSLVVSSMNELVAVGSDTNDHEALVWTSADGQDWREVPGEPSRQYYGKIRMTDVTSVGDQLLGVGNFVGVQFGTATAWVSRDAVHWEQSPEVPVMEQGEPYAVVPAGPGAVAVGSFGAPDNYIPTVWLSPAR